MVSVDRREWLELLDTLEYLRQRDAHLASALAKWDAFGRDVDHACKLVDTHVALDRVRADLAALVAAAPVPPPTLARPPLGA